MRPEEFGADRMFAVVRAGGKQYRVAPNDVIVVEKLAADAGAEIELDQVLMLDNGKGAEIGTPLVDGARVAVTVMEQGRGAKVIAFKKKRRKDYRLTHGHRQSITVLRVNQLLAKGEKRSAAKPAAKKPAAKAEAKPADEKPKAKAEAAAKKPAAKKPAAKAKPAAKKPAPKKPAAKKKAPARKAAKPKGKK